MNLAVVPYHDWRKILVEGNRTRDAHFIENFRNLDSIRKLVIINRPVTYPELIIKKKLKRITGKILLSKKGFRLIQVDTKTYVIDFISTEFLKHIIQKRDWYFSAYSNKFYLDFILEAYEHLGINKINYISFNIYAAYMFDAIKDSSVIFDAWDNFVKFPFTKSHLFKIKQAYLAYKNNTIFWTTNARTNLVFYKEHYQVNKIKIISNGVDIERFNSNECMIPEDLKRLPGPIVGFGGKITHLFDASLFNYLLSAHPNKSFVIVGQVLNKAVFQSINKTNNFYYLGDKPYDLYPQYVKSFDICIIPYVLEQFGHGADTIKAYEFISAHKKTVGTSSSGMGRLSEYIYVCDDKKVFSDCLSNIANEKKRFHDKSFQWQFKAREILNMFPPPTNL